MMRLYIHGVTEELAHQILEPDDIPLLESLLMEPGFPRRDNVMAFLAQIDRGSESARAILAFLAEPPQDPSIPEEDRALLAAPQVLGFIASRGDQVAFDALMTMTADRGERRDEILSRAAARADDPPSYRADLLEMALRGLAYAGSHRALGRLRDIERGTIDLGTNRSLAPAARRALDLFHERARPSRPAAAAPTPQGTSVPGAGSAQQTGGSSSGRSADALPPASPGDSDILDSMPRAHELAITYANHVDHNDPMTNARLDQVLRGSSLRAGRLDYAEDVSCCISLERSGAALTWGAPGDGLDIIDDFELGTALANPTARVKVVRQINWCGPGGPPFVWGCASGNSFVVVRLSNITIEEVLWIHELGHNCGLGHSANSHSLMYPFVDQGNDGLSQQECDAYHNPQPGSGLVPLDIGACTDGDQDGVQDGFDNCDAIANFPQDDFDLDRMGNVCDLDDDNDLVEDAADCVPLDALTWGLPGDPVDLALTHAFSGTVLTWGPPAVPGGLLQGVRYDTLRADSPMEFDSNAVCTESDDGSDAAATTNPPLTSFWSQQGGLINANFGASVASAGDVDGDGNNDVIVGAPRFYNGQDLEGRAFVYGEFSSGLWAVLWVAEGNLDLALYGASVASAGDVNNDGYDDVIVGAPGFEDATFLGGTAFVHHGSPSGPEVVPAWSAHAGTFSASFGASVASAGDVNNDGYDDVIVGAPAFENTLTSQGAAFLYSGSASGLETSADWAPLGAQTGARFGASVASAGDINADGYDDVIVGVPGAANGQAGEGLVEVYLGSPDGLGLAPSQTLEIDVVGASFGTSVASARDVNGDGYGDVIVGADRLTNGQTNEGAAFIFHGSAAGLLTPYSWWQEGNQARASFGAAVASAGDFNHDGFDDVLVGAPLHNTAAGNDAGRVLLFAGTAGGMSPMPLKTVEGSLALAQLGSSVAGAGDVDGDGVSDIILGARAYTDSSTGEGKADLYRGSIADPPIGGIFYYNTRAENNCGSGPLGFDSLGIPRVGRTCP